MTIVECFPGIYELQCNEFIHYYTKDEMNNFIHASLIMGFKVTGYISIGGLHTIYIK